LVDKVKKLKSSKSSVIGGESATSAVPSAPQKQRTKKKATAPNPLASTKAKPDSANSKKKKQNKFRK
jgi:hypothetical protein